MGCRPSAKSIWTRESPVLIDSTTVSFTSSRMARITGRASLCTLACRRRISPSRRNEKPRLYNSVPRSNSQKCRSTRVVRIRNAVVFGRPVRVTICLRLNDGAAWLKIPTISSALFNTSTVYGDRISAVSATARPMVFRGTFASALSFAERGKRPAGPAFDGSALLPDLRPFRRDTVMELVLRVPHHGRLFRVGQAFGHHALELLAAHRLA